MTTRSEEHTSELQSLMRISYAVFCLKKKNHIKKKNTTTLNKLTRCNLRYSSTAPISTTRHTITNITIRNSLNSSSCLQLTHSYLHYINTIHLDLHNSHSSIMP